MEKILYNSGSKNKDVNATATNAGSEGNSHAAIKLQLRNTLLQVKRRIFLYVPTNLQEKYVQVPF